jgi:hypothetical protein
MTQPQRRHELEAKSGWGRCESWFEVHSNRLALLMLGVGLVVRLGVAWGTFLNPDEALHYLIANQASWRAAYQASLTTAHPPLLILLLCFWRTLGVSEFVLRLPSVLGVLQMAHDYLRSRRWLDWLCPRDFPSAHDLAVG